MAFVDFHAAGEAAATPAPGVQTASRAWPRRRLRRGSARRWRSLLVMAATLTALAVTAQFATHVLDDPLLGMLCAVLFYAMAAPVAAQLLVPERAGRAHHTNV